MRSSELLEQNPEILLRHLHHASEKQTLTDANEWLLFFEAAGDRAREAWENDDTEAAKNWAKVADFAISYLIDHSQEQATSLYKRINFRILLMRHLRSGGSEFDLTDTAVVIAWLKAQLASYQRDIVEILLKRWNEKPHQLLHEELWALRKLRFWVVLLSRLSEMQDIEIENDLLVWLELRNQLP